MDVLASSGYTVTGQITTARVMPAAGVTVRVFQRDSATVEHQAGPAATTDADGRYAIRVSDDGHHDDGHHDDRRSAHSAKQTSGGGDGQRPTVFIRVFDGDEKVGESEAKRVDDDRVTIELWLSDPGPLLQVKGTVATEEYRPMAAARVRATDVFFGGERTLGEVVTDARGGYLITYRYPQGDLPDLRIEVLSASGTRLAVADIRYNAGPDEVIDVSVPTVELPRPDEYRRLVADLSTQLQAPVPAKADGKPGVVPAAANGGVSLTKLREDDERRDITYLANKTGWDGRLVAMASLAEQYSVTSTTSPRTSPTPRSSWCCTTPSHERQLGKGPPWIQRKRPQLGPKGSSRRRRP